MNQTQSNPIYFCKMESMGNDFVLLDGLRQSIPPFSEENILHLAHRRFGIGFDQLLILEPPSEPEHDFRLRIFNADASEAKQCGNGARSATQFAYDHALCPKRPLIIETLSGPIQAQPTSDGQIDVCLGGPRAYQKLAALWPNAPDAYYLDLGNPHCVFIQRTIDEDLLSEWGAKLQRHNQFPEGVNVSFLHPLNTHHLKVRTFERGVGLTLSCGSGAAAAAIVAVRELAAHPSLTVEVGGGQLTLRWDFDSKRVHLIGKVTTVFEGSFIPRGQSPHEPPVSEFCDH